MYGVGIPGSTESSVECLMKCPYLAGNYMFSCIARREVYIPSTIEFAEYCNSEQHGGFKVCSYYMESSGDHK